jgi:hypothetical protein
MRYNNNVGRVNGRNSGFNVVETVKKILEMRRQSNFENSFYS